MRQTQRQWALEVLGLQESFTNEDLDRAYAELTNLWSPHAAAHNPKTQTQGQQELSKIEQAKSILSQPEPQPAQSGIQPWVVGTFVASAFLLGFAATYVYKSTHKPAVKVMIPPSVLTSGRKVRLDAPDITVSSQRITAPQLTTEEQQQVESDIQRLSDEEPSFAMNDLESMGEKAIPSLVGALSSRDDNVRMNATTILNSIAAGPDDEPNTPEDMLKLRPVFQTAGAVVALERLSNDPVDDTRQNVAYALGNIGDRSSFDTLVRMASDNEAAVRSGVAYSLGKLQHPDGITTLSGLLDDDDSSVRMSAASALGSFHSEEAKAVLRDRLPQENDSDVQASIQAALDDRGNQDDDGQGV